MFTPGFDPSQEYAQALDRADPISTYRDLFHLPKASTGKPCVYLCGHSLGLMPKAVRSLIDEELRIWADLGVEGHFQGTAPWYRYHETVRESGARLLGARPDEVVFMNSLTVNLHLLMATFYRPTTSRSAILIDEPTFPSDRYAIVSQLQHHGFDRTSLLTCSAAEDEIEELLDREGRRIALVFLSGVNFLTGRVLDLARLAKAAHRQGCVFGVDLAHAIGNVPLALHDWNIDFAVWCSYKYLNGGPGAVGGAYVHYRHGQDRSLPRFAGWWGNDPDIRFRMQLEPDFIPQIGADGWQVSNPPILSLAPLRVSLRLFDEVSLTTLRNKSLRLTGYLLDLLMRLSSDRLEILTPVAAEQRGCQLSLRIKQCPREVQLALSNAGVSCDFREPDVLRVAPVPLYNSFEDVWNFAQILTGSACTNL